MAIIYWSGFKEKIKRFTTYNRSIKRKATKYNNDYRIWHDYAGSYKNK